MENQPDNNPSYHTLLRYLEHLLGPNVSLLVYAHPAACMTGADIARVQNVRILLNF